MPNPGPMACPVDGTTLTMSERQGIEIDYCPSCRGMWLDRGELDKIIERGAAPVVAPAPVQTSQAPLPPQQQGTPWGQPSFGKQPYGHDPRYHGNRKKSFLEDLFD